MKTRRGYFARAVAAYCMTLAFAATMPLFGPPAASAADVLYGLQAGSQLVDDCPICAHLSPPVPMQGTFRLHFVEANPLFGTYGLQEISFQAGSGSTPQYTVTGSGTYEFGGPMGSIQNATFQVRITNGSQSTLCELTNVVGSAGTVWPLIQIEAEQTNGTDTHTYHLKIVAVPIPQFTAIVPDAATGDIRLEWSANGQPVQVQRAENAGGPYLAVSLAITDSSFTDVGALTNRTQSFYRLVQP